MGVKEGLIGSARKSYSEEYGVDESNEGLKLFRFVCSRMLEG